ncbi:MAG: hypothetical protein RLZZ127_452 [Planctomycetota bacterium]|jgi:RNA polymerase sigma factor (sigma-70 family)
MVRIPTSSRLPAYDPAVTVAPAIAGMPATAGDTAVEDRRLLDRYVVAGDEEAFAALVARHGELVRRVCHRVLDDDAEAEDAAVDALAALAARAREIPPEVPLAGWLHQAAWRCARTRRQSRAARHRRERPIGDMAAPGESPASDLDAARAILTEELDRLDPQDRDLVRWCCIEGTSRKEAADRLGVPAGSVHRRLQRALDDLRRRLTGRGVAAPMVAVLLPREAAPRPVAVRRAAARSTSAGPFLVGAAAAGVVGVLVALTLGPGTTAPITTAASGAPAPTARGDAADTPRGPLARARSAPISPPMPPVAASRSSISVVTNGGLRVEKGSTTLDGRRVTTWTVDAPPTTAPADPDERIWATIRPDPLPEAFRLSFLIRTVNNRLRLIDDGTEVVQGVDDAGRPLAWRRRTVDLRRLSDGSWESRIMVRDREISRWVTKDADWDQGMRISLPEGRAGRVIVADISVTPR